jgi:DNA-binding transcriptional LysR family regulator
MFKFDLVSLMIYVAAIEHGNLAKASRQHRIAASAASKRMSDLESRLGIQLMQRSKMGVTPTPAGKTFYAHAKEIIRLAEAATASVAARPNQYSGVVSLWSNTSALVRHLPHDLARFSTLFPGVVIDLREASSEEIIDAVRAGNAQLGIVSSHADARGLQSDLYFRDDLVVITAQGHELASRRFVSFDELEPFDNLGLPFRDAATTIPKRIRSAVLNFESIRAMVADSLGIAVVPESTVTPLQRGLSVVRLNEPLTHRHLLIVHRSRSLTRAAASLKELLTVRSTTTNAPFEHARRTKG